MILFCPKRSGRSMADKLSAEIVAAFNEEGGAFKRKEDTHRMPKLTVHLHISGFSLVNGLV